jgi:hypothetical protein
MFNIFSYSLFQTKIWIIKEKNKRKKEPITGSLIHYEVKFVDIVNFKDINNITYPLFK